MVSSPSPPNPYTQAAAQQSADLYGAQASSIVNNANETNPYGSVHYSNAGYETIYDAKGQPSYVPRYNRDVQLSPDQMRLLGLQTQAQGNAGQAAVTASGQLADHFKTSLDSSQWQPWSKGQAPGTLATTYGGNAPVQTSIGSGGAIRQDQAPTDRAAVEQAMMGRYRENAGKQATSEDAQLAARGLNPGGQGYGQVADTRARALTDASQQAYLASGAESRASQDAYNQAQNQRFGQGAAQGQFANQAQQQAYQQAQERAGFGNTAKTQQYQMGNDYASFLNNLRQGQQTSDTALRNQLPNEVAALMGMGQVTTPQFQPFSRQGVNAAPVGQYMSDAYKNQLAASSAANQGIFGLGSSLIGAIPFSDRRLKTNIEPTGGQLAGLPLYWFRYRGQPELHVGVMADEVREAHPDAVVRMGGFDAVNYDLLYSRGDHHG